MLNQLLLNNSFYAVHIFTFLAFFMAGWLHFDSWKVNKDDTSYLTRAIGFFAVSLSFLYASSQTDHLLYNYISDAVKFYGLALIFFGLISTPILEKPKNAAFVLPFSLSIPFALVLKFSPIALSFICLLIAAIYFIRATKGLEKQIIAAGFSFSLLFVSEGLAILYLWKDSSVVYVSKALSEFGSLSVAIIVLQFIAAIILLVWSWTYVRFRAEVQLFLTTLILTLFVFIVTTFSFNFLLLKNIEKNVLTSVETDAKVVLYTLERLQFEALANSKAASFEKDITDGDFEVANDFLLTQNLGFLNVIDESGKLIVSAEDESLKNVGFSDNPDFVNAITGKPHASLTSQEGPTAPVIKVSASYPTYTEDDEDPSGVITSGFYIDSAFVDGIKDLTNLDITLFGGDTRSATTIYSDESSSRFIGTKADENISDTVLNKNEKYLGAGKVNNTPYYLVYLPLTDYNQETIGMVAAGRPQAELIKSAKDSFNTTFTFSALLMLVSIIPVYFVAKFIQENITA